MWLRAIVTLTFNILYVNTKLKTVVIDSVGCVSMTPLISRVVQNFITIGLSYTSLKYFSLTTVALVGNMAPLCACFLGVCVFSETITRREIITIFIALVAVTSMILGAKPTESTAQDSTTPFLLAWVFLFATPIAMSTGKLLNRVMKKLHESVISFYANLAQVVLMPLLLYLFNGGAITDNLGGYSIGESLVIVGIGASAFCSQLLFAKAC